MTATEGTTGREGVPTVGSLWDTAASTWDSPWLALHLLGISPSALDGVVA